MATPPSVFLHARSYRIAVSKMIPANANSMSETDHPTDFHFVTERTFQQCQKKTQLTQLKQAA
jgi:hypothetical protein